MSPLKLAVVGGGPSAFYVASRILTHLLPHEPSARVHLFDRLWAPHGLVRYGVAPDHPEVKNCTHKFDQAADDPRLAFFGNVEVLSPSAAAPTIPSALPLPFDSLLSAYTHVLFASGCPEPATHPALPPSSYCLPALGLVHWYTAHPLAPPPPPLHSISHVSLIGNGNVSLDIARMLLAPVDHLAKFDVPEHVLEVLASSTVRHVSIIARRGPLEAACTAKELRELLSLPDAAMAPLDSDLIASVSPTSTSPPNRITRQQSRILQLLSQGSKAPFGSSLKTFSFDFFRSPIGLTLPSPSTTPSRPPAQLTLAHTSLAPSSTSPSSSSHAVPTGTTSTLSTDLVVPSLGFRAAPTTAFFDPGLGHLRVLGNRVVDINSSPSSPTLHGGMVVPGIYASGWAATGARGVLASTMMNAYDVAETIVSDWRAGVGLPSSSASAGSTLDLEAPPDEVASALTTAGRRVTTYADWRAIDEYEQARGAEKGKERERVWSGWMDVLIGH